MYEIFISYRHEAGHFAGRIYDFLAARGYSAFLDVATMHQGRFVTSREIPRNDSGGNSTHRSSSGSTHGGTGSRF